MKRLVKQLVNQGVSRSDIGIICFFHAQVSSCMASATSIRGAVVSHQGMRTDIDIMTWRCHISARLSRAVSCILKRC